MKTGARAAYTWFDALRFVAALVVVIEHARDLTMVVYAEAGRLGLLWKAFYALTIFGHPAVIVFFVLSGFWISKTVDRKIGDARFWAEYLTDRLSRLLIVLVPALLIGAALDWTGIHALGGAVYAGTSGSLTIAFPVASRLTVAALLGNLAFVQTLLVTTPGSNGALWSLANEFWYYLCYPPLLLLVVRRRASAGLAALLVLAAFPHLLPGFAVWLMGSAVYHVDKRWRIGRRAGGLVLAMALPALAAALVAARAHMLGDAVADLAVGIGFAGVCWGLLLLEPAPPRLLAPVARYGAGASYSLYVTHLPLLVLLAGIVVETIGGGRRLMPGAGSLALLVALVAAVVIAAWLFAALTEARTPWLRARVRRALGLAPPRADAAGARDQLSESSELSSSLSSSSPSSL